MTYYRKNNCPIKTLNAFINHNVIWAEGLTRQDIKKAKQKIPSDRRVSGYEETEK